MAQWWNSSIKAWESFDGSLFLDTDGDVDLPYRDPLQPCQYVNWTLPNTDESTFGQPLPIKTNVSCAQICNDSISLFGSQQNNLVNCGLWSTLVSAYNFVDRSIQVADRSVLKAFEEVGLDTSVPQYIEWATTYMDTIGACFMYLYQNVKQYTFADDGTVLGSCTIEALFTYSPNITYNITNFYDDTVLGTLDQLRDCVEDICSPVTLNPDLAGIGVFSSFLIQSGIAILAFVGLLALELSPWLSKRKRERRTENLITTVVSFHKAQCYFASTIQIAGLVLAHDSLIGDASLSINGGTNLFHDFVDTSVLVVLATSGFIPICLTRAIITHHEPQGWYLLILSLMTTLLATATLSASYFYANKYGGAGNYYASPQDNVFQTVDGNPICNITGHVGDIIYPLCGTDSLNNSAIGAGTVTNGWVWVGWVICVSWLAFCFFQKMFSSNGSTSHGPALHAASPNQATSGAPKALAKRSLLRTFLFMITSTLCFGGQFYLFTVYLRHSYISYEWSFGQIIAVTVWIPSVVEFFYNSVGKLRALEFPYQGKDERLTWSAGVERAARYRYPSPLRVIRGMALTLADLNPQGTTPAAALRVSNVQTLYDMQ